MESSSNSDKKKQEGSNSGPQSAGSEQLRHAPTPTQQTANIRPQYVMPIPSTAYIQSTPNHPYHGPPMHQPYYFSQGAYPMSPYSQPIYHPPSPMFMSNPYLPTPASMSSLYDDQMDHASSQMDGMLPKGAKAKERKPEPPKDFRRVPVDEKDKNFGNLKELLYDTLQQEVAALDVLKKQINQFAAVTANAEKFCNMNALNHNMQQQAMPSPNRSPPMPRMPVKANPVPGLGRPAAGPLPARPRMGYPPPPPQVHIMNRARPPPLGNTQNPLTMAYQTLHEVENRLKNCEKAVSSKIQMYETHIKGGALRNNPKIPPKKMNPRDIENMTVKTLQDVEKNLKATERNAKKPNVQTRDIGFQTPDKHMRGKVDKPKQQQPESLMNGLSNRVEEDLLESKFAKKIILLMYSHLRKLARCAVQKEKKAGDKVNYKELMEQNGIVFTVPNSHPDEFDELAINIELKVPMSLFDYKKASEKVLKDRKLGDALRRCKRKCCRNKRKRGKKCSDGGGYQSEPESHHKSRKDGCEVDKKRHCSAPQRRLTSEEEDMEVLAARTKRIKEYLDSTINCMDRVKEDFCPEDTPVTEDCSGEQRLGSEAQVEEVCVENASKQDRDIEVGQHHHRHHHHHHHKHHQHHHKHHPHLGLDALPQEKRISWPKDAYLEKYQHHGTFWPMWTESPYCREAKTLQDVPTKSRDPCLATPDDDHDWDPRLRRWSDMDGAQGSHFTSVSDSRNDIYMHLRDNYENCAPLDANGCPVDMGVDANDLDDCNQQCLPTMEPACGSGGEECHGDEMCMSGGMLPYHMEFTMAGHFIPEAITRVMSPGPCGGDDCSNSPRHPCLKGTILNDGLEYNYY